jgi:hypothetical protein
LDGDSFVVLKNAKIQTFLPSLFLQQFSCVYRYSRPRPTRPFFSAKPAAAAKAGGESVVHNIVSRSNSEDEMVLLLNNYRK